MKKRSVTLSLVLTLLLSTLLVLSGCGDKGPGGEMTEDQAELLSLLPDNAAGIFLVNFKKFTRMKFFDQMIKEAEEKKIDEPGAAFKGYQDFIDKTGIDPKKDIYSMAFAIYGKIGPMAGEPDVAAVINLNYNKNSIMGLIKENAPEFAEDTYNGVAIFEGKDKKGKDMAFSFIGEKTMAAGTPYLLKQVIDISKTGGQGVMGNAKMKPYLGELKPGAIMSFVIDFPEEAKKAQEGGMFKMDLSKAEVVLGYVDYSGSAWDGEIALISHNEEGNKQMVSTLNAFKMMGGALGPEVEELISNLDISASADSVKIKLSISDELLEKLKKKVEEQRKGLMGPRSSGSPFGS